MIRFASIFLMVFAASCSDPQKPDPPPQTGARGAVLADVLLANYCAPLGSHRALTLHSRRELREALKQKRDAGEPIGEAGEAVVQAGYPACPTA